MANLLSLSINPHRLLVCLVLLGLLACVGYGGAQDVPAVPSTGFIQEEPQEDAGFFMEVFRNLFNSEGLLRTLSKPQYALAAFIILNLIVFTETGLLVGFCLPGDSLLVTAGVACYMADWNVALLMLTLSISAIVGDSVGYSIGYKAGPRIFNREKSWFFRKDHLLKAQEFYEKHGGKTIVIARFVPIIRTFAPVVAGAGRMHYPRFLFFNVAGGIGWVVSLVMCGYFLTTLVNPALRPIFGEDFDVKKHIEKVILLVVFLSVLPMFVAWWRHRSARKAAPALTPEPELAGEKI